MRWDLVFLFGNLASGLRLARGISRAVEVNEEVEVGPDDEASEEVAIALIAAAVLCVSIVVDNGGRVGDENDDELQNLNGSDVFLPPNLFARVDDHHEVVPVPEEVEFRENVSVFGKSAFGQSNCHLRSKRANRQIWIQL